MPRTSELLAELSSFDDLQAWVPRDDQQRDGVVPMWTEVVLEASRTGGDFPVNIRVPLRRHDGEAIIATLHEALHPRGAGTITDTLWLELDDVVDKIQKRVKKKRPPKPEHVGVARGLATAIAIMVSPYAYDVDAIREQAMDRWAERAASR